MLDRIGGELVQRERASVREPGVVARALQQHFAVGCLCAREPRVGAAAHDSVDYRSAKKSRATLLTPWKSRAINFESSPLPVPVRSATAAIMLETSFPLP